MWLAAAIATSLVAAAGVRSGAEKAILTPNTNRVKKLSPPQPGDKIRQTRNKKVQLAKHSKAAKSDSRLADQGSIKAVPVET